MAKLPQPKEGEERTEDLIETIGTQSEEPRSVQQHQPQQATQIQGGDEISMLMQQAIMQNTPIETMKELLAMRRELRAEKAKEAFDRAMSGFQADCPVIEKKKKVYEKNSTTKVRYSFAPIDDIIAQTKEPMGKHGLSYAFKTIQTEKEFGIICIAKHIMGHAEETSFVVPIGTEDYMTNVQKFGARNTFCKRYAFCNAFGISTGDEDTDAGEKDKAVDPKGLISSEDADRITDTDTQEALHKLCAELKKKYVKPEALKALISLYNEHRKALEDGLIDEVAEGLEKEKEAKNVK